jgi:hypothetical protein
MSRFAIALLLMPMSLLLFPYSTLAGWVETDTDGNVTYLQEGKIKEAAPDDTTWTAIDLKNGTVLLVDTARRIFAQGKIEEHCDAMAAMIKTSMEILSPEERALMEQLLRPEKGKKVGKPQVSVVSKGKGPTIAGYATVKYEVLANGKLYEELWLAPDAEVLKEIDPVAIRSAEKKMSACTEMVQHSDFDDTALQVEKDPTYQGLMGKGWPLRAISYNNGIPLHEQTIASLQKKEIPASEFQAPKGFRKVPFGEFMFED